MIIAINGYAKRGNSIPPNVVARCKSATTDIATASPINKINKYFITFKLNKPHQTILMGLGNARLRTSAWHHVYFHSAKLYLDRTLNPRVKFGVPLCTQL